MTSAERNRKRVPVVLRGSLLIRTGYLVLGLILCAVGIVGAVRSTLGAGPWAVLAQGLAKHLPLSFGNTTVAISIALIAIAWILGAQIGLGTIADAILVGLFIDLLDRVALLSRIGHENLGLRVAVLAVAICAFSVGSAVYLATALGGGPRDALMLAVWSRTGVAIAYSRPTVELIVLVLGAALGGTFGIGTVALTMLVGPTLQIALRALRQAGLASATSEPGAG
jgi:uncharacterized membrane protein YczE